MSPYEARARRRAHACLRGTAALLLGGGSEERAGQQGAGKRIRGAALAAAGLVLAAGGTGAHGVEAADPGSVLAAVRAFGHEAQLAQDEAGFPVVLARVGEINYGVQFYGCEGTTNCSQLQFAATFDLDPGLSTDYANQRNEAWAIGRISVSPEGDPLFTYFLTTEGGLSAENFRAVMRLWTDALAATVEEIGY